MIFVLLYLSAGLSCIGAITERDPVWLVVALCFVILIRLQPRREGL